MLQGVLIKFDKNVFYEKLLQKWLDTMYSCTQNMLPKINMHCR